MTDADVIVVGTGPAGVSAAHPLVEAGLRVVLVDGGRQPFAPGAGDDYLTLRRQSPDQWRLFVGEDFHALRARLANSPKFRAPTLAPVFEGYDEAYRPVLDNFTLIGSLASGGLSNAWGAGVAMFDNADLHGTPIDAADLAPSYRAIAARIGISGAADDDLGDYFGAGHALQPAPALDSNARALLDRYRRRAIGAGRNGVRLGLARNAVLTQPLEGRDACDRSALCLWGCGRKSIYSARYDLERLESQPNCRHVAMIVTAVARDGAGYRVEARDGKALRAPRIILACGAVGTARLVFALLGHIDKPVPLLSTPGAGFALLLPRRIGCAADAEAFGLAQLSFTVPLSERSEQSVFGNLFGTAGIPMYEFVRRAPLARRSSQKLLRLLLPAMLAGNCFLPGEFSAHRLWLDRQGRLAISGGYRDEAADRFVAAKRRLAAFFRACGAILLPGSFSPIEPGADAHYAGTVPMKADPAPHEIDRNGELAGAPGLYVADGAALTRLPAKAHTLTIMANADRIGRVLADRLKSLRA